MRSRACPGLSCEDGNTTEVLEMTKVLAAITMSMDGYIAGPNDRLGAGLGDGGEALHYWIFGGPWTYDNEGGSRRPRSTGPTSTSCSRRAAPGSSAARCTTWPTAGATIP